MIYKLVAYSDRLEETLENVPRSNIFNYDETATVDTTGKKKMLYRRGVKYPTRIENFSKLSTTMLVCGSANGVLLPPYILYKNEHIYKE